MNIENKKLIAQEELKDIMRYYLIHKMDEILSVMQERFSEEKQWEYDHSDGFFIWGIWDNLGRREHYIAAKLFDNNQWCIYTNGHHGESINIIVYPDHVEFIENSVFIVDSFDKECMRDLYMKIKLHLDVKNMRYLHCIDKEEVTRVQVPDSVDIEPKIMEKYIINNQPVEKNDKEEEKADEQ